MTMNELFDMSGVVTVVTGGATHLGKAISTGFGELGATVYIASRRRELCEEVASEMRGSGIDCTGLGCDATDEAQVNGMVERIVEQHGKLDVMVCNAGGSATKSYIPNASIDEFVETLDMNLKSTYLCAQAAARVMIPKARGKIITLGSIHGSLGADKRQYQGIGRSGPPYQAAKGGIVNLTRGLATELGAYGITVNCLSPGQIPPPTHDSGLVERWRVNNPLQRTGVPEHIKGAAALLASDAGDWITGHNLVVDGGWSAW